MAGTIPHCGAGGIDEWVAKPGPQTDRAYEMVKAVRRAERDGQPPGGVRLRSERPYLAEGETTIAQPEGGASGAHRRSGP